MTRALVVLLVGNVFEFYTFNKETGPRDRLVPWFGGGVVAPVLILVFMLNPRSKAWFKAKGGKTF